MKFIGVTGGVGSGKSAILEYLEKRDGIRVMLADEIAHELMKPQTECYRKIAEVFWEDDIFTDNQKEFDKGKLAKVIFSNNVKRKKLNDIVHPAVRRYIVGQYKYEKERGKLFLLVLEAALLIEEHYDTICDELWYVYASKEQRRRRLKESRGYSDEKIDNIFQSQLEEEEYRKACSITIDNNGSLEETFEQIDKVIRSGKE